MDIETVRITLRSYGRLVLHIAAIGLSLAGIYIIAVGADHRHALVHPELHGHVVSGLTFGALSFTGPETLMLAGTVVCLTGVAYLFRAYAQPASGPYHP